MKNKRTCKELEQRNKDLEESLDKHKQAEKALQHHMCFYSTKMDQKWLIPMSGVVGVLSHK